jgi:hypothetical protein
MKIETFPGAEHLKSARDFVRVDDIAGRSMPAAKPTPAVELTQYFQAVDNFTRTFAITAADTVLFLADPLLDPRVISAVHGIAKARGAKFHCYTAASTQHAECPPELRPLVEKATFVVSTWFCSALDPFFVNLRRNQGQRWVKITFFRDLDLLHTPQARFPIDVVGELIRATGRRFPRDRDAMDLVITDERGSNLTVGMTRRMIDGLLRTNRWKGEQAATSPGCYVHYLATHGPNFFERLPSCVDSPGEVVVMNGTLYPQWSVGIPRPFSEKVGVRWENDVVVEVTGSSPEAEIIRRQVIGGKIIELSCGFNPKAPRHKVYPAGSNAPGALHFGIDLVEPDDYIRRTMPDWEEPPVHVDLITFDSTVTLGGNTLVEEGFLVALRDPEVVALAARYGDPLELLEAPVM